MKVLGLHRLIQAWFLILVWPALSCFAQDMNQASISVHPAAQVDGDEILLGEVAEITAPPLLESLLADLSLGRSPKPGKGKTIKEKQFHASLRSHQDLLSQVSVSVPEVIYIKRRSQILANAEIRDAVDAYLQQYFENREYAILEIELPDEAEYPVGQLDLMVLPGQKVDKKGKFSFHAEVSVNRQKVDRIRVTGRVALYDTVVCGARDLLKGETLDQDKLVLEKKNLFTLRGAAVTDASQVTGMVLKTDVRMGIPIRRDWVKEVPLIRKGDVVTLVARNNNLVIVTSGVSMEDGFMNGMIRVENPGSGKIVRGMVKEAATVEVVF